MRASKTIPALVALSVAAIVMVGNAAGATARVTVRVSVGAAGAQGNGLSFSTVNSISADGRFVAFDSDASNLVAGDTNNTRDVFVYDRTLHTTRRVSVGSLGQGNGASFDAATPTR